MSYFLIADPPEYYMLDVPAKPVSDPGMPPLDYDTVMAEPVSTSPNNIDELEKIKQPKDSLIGVLNNCMTMTVQYMKCLEYEDISPPF